MQLTGIHHLAAMSAKPRGNLAFCTSALGTRQLRDYAAPHANAQARAFAMGEGGPADQDDGRLPAIARQEERVYNDRASGARTPWRHLRITARGRAFG
jgi:catechol 2,3-dioxygenase-like lactoylglutathione lyase family enzyme